MDKSAVCISMYTWFVLHVRVIPIVDLFINNGCNLLYPLHWIACFRGAKYKS